MMKILLEGLNLRKQRERKNFILANWFSGVKKGKVSFKNEDF